MKFLIVLIAVVAYVAAEIPVLSAASKAAFGVIKDKCLPETNAPADVLDKMIVGDFSNNDKETKCFAKCLYIKSGIFDKDNNLVVKTVLDSVGADFGVENTLKWITPCKNIQHADPCEKAYEIAKCFENSKHKK